MSTIIRMLNHKSRIFCSILSKIQTKGNFQATIYSLGSKEKSEEFMAVFPDIVQDLTNAENPIHITEFTKRYVKLLEYTVPNGKKDRGLALVNNYKILEKPENLTSENIRLANILGWCVEMMQACFIVADDIVDNSEERRGLPCWYRKTDVGLTAVRDAVLIEHAIYTLLKRHFSNHSCYLRLVELFHDVILKTVMGNAQELISSQRSRLNLQHLTMDNYKTIVKYKTAYYTFQLPMTLAMYLANVYDEEMHTQAVKILLEMGLLFQIQDDFLDCFGDPAVTGKRGSDIQENKCSWLAVVAVQKANLAQRKIMEEYYGCPDEEAIKIIRNLYEELNLPNYYAMYEEESFNRLQTQIQEISKNLPQELFTQRLAKIYERVN